VSDGHFPATNHTFNIHVEPVTLSFSRASSSLTIVQGDRLVALDSACLPLVTNGNRQAAVYHVTQAPARGQLFRRDQGAVDEFTQQQVRWRSRIISYVQ